MSIGLDLSMHVGLEQKLSPQMIQSLKLLQMNSLELEMVVKQELETNPLLETLEESDEEQSEAKEGEEGDSPRDEDMPGEKVVEEIAVPEGNEDAVAEGDASEATDLGQVIPEDPQASKEIDWESYLEEGFDYGNKRSEELESPDERFEKVPAYSRSLQDYLQGQLQERTLTASTASLVEYLINSVDERGYLTREGWDREKSQAASAPDEPEKLPLIPEEDPRLRDIQAVIDGSLALEATGPEVREAFHVLHAMDPAGIGARDLRECLLLQIRRLDRVGPLAQRLVSEAFDLLEKLKISAMAKKFEVTPEQVQAALREIGSLEPHPGLLISASVAQAVTPDLIVEAVEGELVLMLNDKTVPSLKISRAYAGLLKKGSRAGAGEKKFVREKLNSAIWLIRAIEQRKSTMIKVMRAIMESQPDFFGLGPTHLRPLILQDVADKIGMHISTVSRVTNGKYVQTNHGIFELKYFFSAGVTQADGSEVSSVTTKDEIKKLIEGEDAKRPLSDQKIVEMLKTAGLDVARRTVAKYRDQLEILPARLRKQY